MAGRKGIKEFKYITPDVTYYDPAFYLLKTRTYLAKSSLCNATSRTGDPRRIYAVVRKRGVLYPTGVFYLVETLEQTGCEIETIEQIPEINIVASTFVYVHMYGYRVKNVW